MSSSTAKRTDRCLVVDKDALVEDEVADGVPGSGALLLVTPPRL
jgi:hypothetical protein